MALPELGVRITGDLNGLNSAITGGTGSLRRFDTFASTVSRNITQNVSNINRVNFSGFQRSLQQGQISLSNLQTQAQRTVPAINAVNQAVNRSRTDFTNWGRVIQDAPFGFIGIQNNLTQLIPSAGLAGLAFSALVSAITFAQVGTANWTRGLDGNSKALKKSKEAAEEYEESLTGVAKAQLDGTKAAQEDLTNLRLLFTAYQNGNLPIKDRKTAYKQLQQEYPEYFKNIRFEQEAGVKTKQVYDSLTQSILANARARAASDLIATNSGSILTDEQRLQDLQKQKADIVNRETASIKKRVEFQNKQYNDQQKGFKISKEAEQVQLNQIKNLDKVKNIDAQIFEIAKGRNELVKQNLSLEKYVGGQQAKGATLVDLDEENVKAGKSLSDIYEELNKALAKTEVQFGTTFGEKNKAQMAAYQSAIDAATDAFGRQSDAVKKLQVEQRKLFQLSDLPLSPSAAAATAEKDLPRNSKGGLTVLPDLTKRGIPGSVDKELKKAFESFNNDVSRSIDRFGRRFGETLFTLNEQADQSFEGIFSTLSKELTGALNDVFLGQFTDMLSELVKTNMDNLSKEQKTALSAVGLAGGLISGVTKKTNTGGQAIGGALTGGAAGFAVGGPVGAAIGGIVGALGGIFGAKKAREQEKLQQDQLVEQKKQTKLLERQNALAYTSSIIGRMTNQGIVSGIEVNEFGQLTTKLSGNDISIVLERANRARGRGV